MYKWTICVLTVPEREQDLTRIEGMLLHQIDNRNDIQLLIDKGTGDVGKKRQRCLEEAAGDYICFVDDDDLIAHDYIERIYELLDGEVDYIGFQLQHYRNGEKQKPTFHSLKYKEWSEDDNGWYRDVSHLNPIKTSIAREGVFEGAYGEDKAWAEQVNPKTEHYIDAPMYFYFFSDEHSLTAGDSNGNA